MIDFPDTELVALEIFDAGLDAIMTGPALADIRGKLSENEMRRIVAVVTEKTALIASRSLVAALSRD